MRNLTKMLRKGISPAITTLILVLVAVAVGMAVYAFVSPMMHPAVTKLNIMGMDAKASADGRTLVISVDLRNSGTVPLNITGVSVMEGTTAISMAWTPSMPYRLAPSGETTITGTASGLTVTLSGGDQLTITIQYKDPSGTARSTSSIVTVQQVA